MCVQRVGIAESPTVTVQQMDRRGCRESHKTSIRQRIACVKGGGCVGILLERARHGVNKGGTADVKHLSFV